MTDISPDLQGIGQQQEDETPGSSLLSGHPPAKEKDFEQAQRKR